MFQTTNQYIYIYIYMALSENRVTPNIDWLRKTPSRWKTFQNLGGSMAKIPLIHDVSTPQTLRQQGPALGLSWKDSDAPEAVRMSGASPVQKVETSGVLSKACYLM